MDLCKQICIQFRPFQFPERSRGVIQGRVRTEKQLIPRIEALDDFIMAETPRLTQVRDSLPNPDLAGYEELNSCFLRLLRDAWE